MSDGSPLELDQVLHILLVDDLYPQRTDSIFLLLTHTKRGTKAEVQVKLSDLCAKSSFPMHGFPMQFVRGAPPCWGLSGPSDLLTVAL